MIVPLSSLNSPGFLPVASSGVVYPRCGTRTIQRSVASDVYRESVDFTAALQIISAVPNEVRFSTRYQELHGIPRCVCSRTPQGSVCAGLPRESLLMSYLLKKQRHRLLTEFISLNKR